MSEIDFVKIMRELGETHPIFTSERDMQFALGWQLKRLGYDIHLEYPVTCFPPLPNGRRANAYIDIVVKRPELVAVELKFGPDALVHDHVTLPGSAANDGYRHGVLTDVLRMEILLSKTDIGRGVCILVSNRKALWTEGTPRNDEAFRIHHGRVVNGELNWRDGTSPVTRRDYPAVSLVGSYRCEWFDYSDIGIRNGLFRCLIVDVRRTAADQ